MKIGIFTDIHANLPALERCISFCQASGCDRIVHLGDLVGIGPFPKECMDLALATSEMDLVMGNHDFWYAFGLPGQRAFGMSVQEVEHQRWTHAQIGPEPKESVKEWPFTRIIKLADIRIAMRHYGLNQKGNWFQPIIKNPTAHELDELFVDVDAQLVCYGHHHRASDITGRMRYLNLGSAGCYHKSVARAATIELHSGMLHIDKVFLDYEDKNLMSAFDDRKVPARDFIRRVFITR